MFDQPIIERKATSPLATSLLVVAAACLLGAAVLMGAQIESLTEPGVKSATQSASTWEDRNTKKTKREVQKALED